MRCTEAAVVRFSEMEESLPPLGERGRSSTRAGFRIEPRYFP
ncbi:hypothetical protein RB3131 [Rhodopirellula baltica SH 1]|uniref:Uncharacterized protein n=1 Tax=Rhodopirellula baltica (strain DSM 10527 / NCIMB 13988 / SH1) TaxID=243090 RepID=Q7UUR3_RHOBA|nr:hypothetical protein RB3131 [Rhodopirellula baltica SH 1]